MPSLKELTNKIVSLKNTAKVTKTMNMVSTSKFRKAQEAQASSRQYSELLAGIVARLGADASAKRHPFLKEKAKVRKILVVAISSDKGLCGGFNNNLIKQTEAWRQRTAPSVEQIDFITAGRRIFSFLRKANTVIENHDGVSGAPKFDNALAIADQVQKLFLDGAYDEIHLAYNRFESTLSQKPRIERLLPIPAVAPAQDAGPANYDFEPSQEELLSFLLPKTVSFSIFKALLDNAAGEHAARMTAMDNATNNAKKLINENTIRRNRARQAAITTELTEIVAGAESLK